VSREIENSLNFRKNRKLGSIWGIRAILGVERQSEIGPQGGNIPAFKACGLQLLSMDFLLVLPAEKVSGLPDRTQRRKGFTAGRAGSFSLKDG
jgi:hypothetical protein